MMYGNKRFYGQLAAGPPSMFCTRFYSSHFTFNWNVEMIVHKSTLLLLPTLNLEWQN